MGTTVPTLGSIRSVRSIDEGFVFVASKTEELYVVVRIDGAGNIIWQQSCRTMEKQQTSPLFRRMMK